MKEKIITILEQDQDVVIKIIPKLDKSFKNILVHTGQNFDYELDKIFLEELNVEN